MQNLQNGPPAAPTGDNSHDIQQTTSLGGNIAANSASAINDAGAADELVVLGNYYQTIAVLQSNQLNERDNITLFAPAEPEAERKS